MNKQGKTWTTDHTEKLCFDDGIVQHTVNLVGKNFVHNK